MSINCTFYVLAICIGGVCIVLATVRCLARGRYPQRIYGIALAGAFVFAAAGVAICILFSTGNEANHK